METSNKTIVLHDIPTMVTIHEGKLPATIFIHGNSLSSREFIPLFSSTVLYNRYYVTYDLPGHGESSRSCTPASTYSIAGYCRHLAALLYQLKIKRFVLVGLSLGGHIAMQAVAGGHIPEPEGLLTIGSPPLESTADFARAFLPIASGVSLFKQFIDHQEAESIATNLGANAQNIPDIKKSILGTDPKARGNLMESLAKDLLHNECQLVSRAQFPMKLCFGEQEKIVNLEYLSEKGLAGRLGAKFAFLPDTGHLPDFSSPGHFESILSNFLEGLDD